MAPRLSSTGLSTAEEYAANIAGVLEKAPFLVAITPDGRLQGFACAHPWHSREAYAWNVEATIYCAPDCVGQGLGKRLYTALLELLRMQGYYNAFAIVTGENKASHEFHKRMGFTKSFVEKHSGYKFGRWLDVVYWQYPLRTGDAPPGAGTLPADGGRDGFNSGKKLICNKANRAQRLFCITERRCFLCSTEKLS